MSPRHEPEIGGVLTVTLPPDITFTEGGALLDGLGELFFFTTGTRMNPMTPVGDTGGIVDPGALGAINLAIATVSVVGVGAFAKRFFELLADDAHAGLRRLVIAISDRVKARRAQQSKTDVLEPLYLFVVVTEPQTHPDADQPFVSLKWQTTDEAELVRLAKTITQVRDSDLPGQMWWEWDSESGTWRPYSLIPRDSP